MKGQASRSKQAAGWARYDNREIVLVPQVSTRTASGGETRADGAPRPMQAWGVAYATKDQVSYSYDGGAAHTMVCTLVGPVGALVEYLDTFTLDGVPLYVNNVRHEGDATYAEAVHDGR